MHTIVNLVLWCVFIIIVMLGSVCLHAHICVMMCLCLGVCSGGAMIRFAFVCVRVCVLSAAMVSHRCAWNPWNHIHKYRHILNKAATI